MNNIILLMCALMAMSGFAIYGIISHWSEYQKNLYKHKEHAYLMELNNIGAIILLVGLGVWWSVHWIGGVKQWSVWIQMVVAIFLYTYFLYVLVYCRAEYHLKESKRYEREQENKNMLTHMFDKLHKKDEEINRLIDELDELKALLHEEQNKKS